MEEETKNQDFWQDKERAVGITQEISNLKEEIAGLDSLRGELNQLDELREMAREDPVLEKEIEEKVGDLEKRIKKEEFKVFLSREYDKGDAILSVYSGAGGQDAQDWATILLRMYQRYCERRGFKIKIISQSFGEVGAEGRIGTKQVSLEVKGSYACGFLKKETGVHRLVRISPFSAQKLRHTSFALVEVLPEIRKETEGIKINSQDLRIDFYRASGPGGQYVNRRESAVRITHLPTKITVSSQSERLQGQNKEIAMRMLYSKLYQLKEREKEKELAEIKGKQVSIEWGSQIRSYVFHPYHLVKDLRTGVETSDVESVLDGNLDQFVEAEIKKINE